MFFGVSSDVLVGRSTVEALLLVAEQVPLPAFLSPISRIDP
jgi:hypothetical protein